MFAVAGRRPRAVVAVTLVVMLVWTPVSAAAAPASAGADPSDGAVDAGSATQRPGTAAARPGARAGPDADGDRLNDSWERAGETPDGVALPDADPRRMDLYVQVNHGTETDPLTERERRQLRRVWARMPVENPDGSTGVRLHLDAEPPRGGRLETTVRVPGTTYDGLTRHYTGATLGPRLCRYHQVVVGRIEADGSAGRGTIPGYAVVVEGDPQGFDGNVSGRVALITHELLHNVVGQVDGDVHVEEGWLAARLAPGDTVLSNATATRLETRGFADPAYFRRRVCR